VVVAPWAGVAAVVRLSCCVRVAPLVRLSVWVLVVESIFTIGFLNDLILITAVKKPNFSAIGVSVCNRPAGRTFRVNPRRRSGFSPDHIWI
jgi:hypothetical protein